MSDTKELMIPNKAWITLKEACGLKGISYKSSCNRIFLQPNRGKAEGMVSGRKVFRRETVIDWLYLTDDQIGEV